MNDMKRAVHLVAGPCGAGKTTYTEQLTTRLAGVAFSIDDWMMSLYGPDLAAPLDPAWVFARVRRCNERILATSMAVAGRGVAVVLDLGLTSKEYRDNVLHAVQAKDFPVRLHWLDAPQAERWARVESRNGSGQKPGAMMVTRSMFDFMEARCEPPTQEELLNLNGQIVWTGSGEA